MVSVRQLLQEKGHQVWSLPPDNTVFDAIHMMTSRNVGALMVIEDGKPIGIITERHVIRDILSNDKSSLEKPLRQVMAKGFLYAGLGQTVEECMAVMTDKRVRHLPVLHEGRLVGIVSIGDLVKSIIGDQQFAIEELIHYISGEGELRFPSEVRIRP